jgi:Ca2+/Na+ antiporter
MFLSGKQIAFATVGLLVCAVAVIGMFSNSIWPIVALCILLAVCVWLNTYFRPRQSPRSELHSEQAPQESFLETVAKLQESPEGKRGRNWDIGTWVLLLSLVGFTVAFSMFRPTSQDGEAILIAIFAILAGIGVALRFSFYWKAFLTRRR